MILPAAVDGDGAELTDARLELARAAPPGAMASERRGSPPHRLSVKATTEQRLKRVICAVILEVS